MSQNLKEWSKSAKKVGLILLPKKIFATTDLPFMVNSSYSSKIWKKQIFSSKNKMSQNLKEWSKSAKKVGLILLPNFFSYKSYWLNATKIVPK